MNAATAIQAFRAFMDKVVMWCVLITKWVICIGLAYAASRMFAIGWINIDAVRIPIPRVTAEPLQLLYLAGAVWCLK